MYRYLILLLLVVPMTEVAGGKGKGKGGGMPVPQAPPGAKLNNRPHIAETMPCDRGAYSCLSCNVGRVCVPKSSGQEYYEISRFTCTDVHPYCNYTSGVCSNSPDPACFDPPGGEETSDFICMRDGHYPSHKSCSRYYICKNKIPYEYKCPVLPTPFYHPRLKHCVAADDFCVDKTSAHFCTRTENHGRKIPVLFTNNYFLYCGVKEILTVDRCIGQYFYDPVSQSCRFVCPYAGLFLSMEHCSKYIKCTAQPQGGFKQETLDCPQGTAFLEEEFSCVDETSVPNCENAHPDSYAK